MRTKFPITSNYDIFQHLGINLEQRTDGRIKLTQPKLLAHILEEYNEDKVCKYPATVPTETVDISEPIETTRYLRLLGKLLYMIHSRPDIATATAYASTKSTSPDETDYKNLLKIVAYLRQSQEYGLTLHPNTSSNPSLHRSQGCVEKLSRA